MIGKKDKKSPKSDPKKSENKQPRPKKDEVRTMPEGGRETMDLSVNKTEDWQQIRQNWAKTQVEKIQAHAENVFITDEELPMTKHITFVMIFLFFVFFVLWASFAQLDEVTRGFGKIIPSSELQEVASLEPGIVDEFLVTKGDRVQKGQVLVRLRDVAATSDLETNRARYLGLLATIARLQAEVEGSDEIDFPEEVQEGAPQSVREEMNTFRANKAQLRDQKSVLEQQLSQRRQEVSELNTRAADLRRVINLSRQEKNVIAPLVERGSAPQLELIQLERGIQERQTDLNGVLQSLPRAKSAIGEAEARINELEQTAKTEAQAELSEKTIEMNSIKSSLAGLRDRRDRTEVTSPVDGIVHNLTVNTRGGVVQAGQPIVQIVPAGEPLFVEARIKPKDIAFLRPKVADRPGQKATVKITAYDYSIYGGLDGELIDISPDTITDEQGETFYRVRVRTDETELRRKGEVLPITTGMEAQVDILTGEKSVMEYLVKPFVKTLNQSMGER
ncbi:MAG: secretion protein HlyD [Micavibrio sp.]|nr:secretion protein HlyD [Micavibrio sp.]